MRNETITKVMSLMGEIGGSASGVCKVRGDSDYYNELRKKGLEKRRKNKNVKKRNLGK